VISIPTDYDTSLWSELKTPLFNLDIRYATDSNFVGKQIYDCGRCFLLWPAAKKLRLAAQQLQALGYKIRIYDCYRPAPAQNKLWEVKPDKRYVAPPDKGSMHSRGLAIDMTIDHDGRAVDMGTAYDYFGREAWSTLAHPDTSVQHNRDILASVMKKLGFTQARSEWWHFSLPGSRTLYDWEWQCKG